MIAAKMVRLTSHHNYLALTRLTEDMLIEAL